LLLVTGGARSGKSRYAQQRAREVGRRTLYVATGVATDDEMAERIARHRAERPADWTTLEARLEVAAAIAERWRGEGCVLLEDLGTLVTNLLVERAADAREVGQEVERLIALPALRPTLLIVVSQEVGLGLVPSTPLGRAFRDLLGVANQTLAAAADEVIMVVAGLPLRLKG
jgi:adenosylcobinamide kinase/adenosylcobinamide-phosphate guanylyltransferase